MMSEPIRVLVTGTTGQIASPLYSIGNGFVFRKDQPVILVLLDITPMMGVLDAQIALKLCVTADDAKRVITWGNHAVTQYPDVNDAKMKLQEKGRVCEVLKGDSQLKGECIIAVQEHGADVTKPRKLSSAMSAAKAKSDHVRDVGCRTPEGKCVSMGVISDDSSHGLPDDLLFSFPVIIKNKTLKFVEGLTINGSVSSEKMNFTAKELAEEEKNKMLLNFFPLPDWKIIMMLPNAPKLKNLNVFDPSRK
ncbi:Malate dehydrogenase, cytoplasmic [Tupaia chinensis]|uniref:Malate dehydrogenase, cytoplasmic n=1 Tax=Tupaia chinensis TaxID=246437 RepID=L9JJU1_TUPCH|nr:Malate dehydrogenase, cytoplasmic [Tupaia chinensis]